MRKRLIIITLALLLVVMAIARLTENSGARIASASPAPNPTAAPTSPACVPAPSGIVAWWPFDGDANDISGLGNHGSPENGGSFAAGEVGQAFNFDGVNDFVQVADDPSLDIANQITIDAWIRPGRLRWKNRG